MNSQNGVHQYCNKETRGSAWSSVCRALLVSPAVLCLLFASVSHAATSKKPEVVPLENVEGFVFEAADLTQPEAEEIFSRADAALWIAQRGLVRWVQEGQTLHDAGSTVRHISPGPVTVGQFREGIDRDYPRLKSGNGESWLLKLPSRLEKPLSSDAGFQKATAALAPQATR